MPPLLVCTCHSFHQQVESIWFLPLEAELASCLALVEVTRCLVKKPETFSFCFLGSRDHVGLLNNESLQREALDDESPSQIAWPQPWSHLMQRGAQTNHPRWALPKVAHYNKQPWFKPLNSGLVCYLAIEGWNIHLLVFVNKEEKKSSRWINSTNVFEHLQCSTHLVRHLRYSSGQNKIPALFGPHRLVTTGSYRPCYAVKSLIHRLLLLQENLDSTTYYPFGLGMYLTALRSCFLNMCLAGCWVKHTWA